MSRTRKAILILFIVGSVAAMWARHSYEQQKRRKMEDTLRSLATYQSAGRASPGAGFTVK